MKSVWALTTLLVFAGCSHPVREASSLTGSGEWGSVVNGLKCRVTTDRQYYRLSEPVCVLVEVTNSGIRPISFGWAEVYLSVIQGDKQNPPYFFNTTLHEFPHKTKSGQNATLQPGDVWERTMVIHPWGPTYSSSPSVASPGGMTLEARFVYRQDSSSVGQSVQSAVVTFEVRK